MAAIERSIITVMIPATRSAMSSSVCLFELVVESPARDAVAASRAAVRSLMSGVTVSFVAVPPETSAAAIEIRDHQCASPEMSLSEGAY